MASWSAMLTRPAQTPASSRPSLTLFFLLVGAFLLTLGYHVINFPIWLSVTIVSAMILRSIIEIYRLPLPSTYFCATLAFIFLGVILVQYNYTIMGRDAGTALTAGLLTIKFYELRSSRDVSVIIFSCFFVVMSVLLYSQILELFIYSLIMMWVLTALLMRVQTGDQQQDHLLLMLGQSGIIYLQALPLGIFLLLAFPRYTGTLSFSMDDTSIGITDIVTPGSVAKLAKDDSIAFSVHFNPRDVPANNSMYWRGMVLWNYENGAWTPGAPALEPELHKPIQPLPESSRVLQEITVRAHYQPWLFALDAPVIAPLNTAEMPSWASRYNGNVVHLSGGRLNHLARYTIYSVQTPIEINVYQSDLQAALQLPDESKERMSSRVKDLAAKLHAGLSDTQEDEYIANVMRYFRDGNFIYSTAPGAQGPNWLPIFLFDTKTGFCEHFAAAFAVLMRLQRIPARLVVGYWGADYNPYSDNYVVSQSNAHAWDEVWEPTDGKAPNVSTRGYWKREDPTAPVSFTGPLAAANGADAQDTLSSQLAHRDTGLYDEYAPSWMKDSLREMELRRDQVESGWDNLVLSYDPETQLRWAQTLGFGNKSPIALLASCLVAAGICVYVFRKWLLRKEPVPPMEVLYALFCQKMAGRGIPRATWEGPLAYTERVAEAFPDDKLAIQRVGSLVAHARYGPVPADAAAQENLKSLLTRLTASQAATSSRDRR